MRIFDSSIQKEQKTQVFGFIHLNEIQDPLGKHKINKASRKTFKLHIILFSVAHTQIALLSLQKAVLHWL